MLSDANAPSHRICYYSLVYDGKIYQGERAWETRWNAIRNIVDFRGKRVLELGCNLGLLSCYAQHAGALSGGIAIDRDHKIIEAAKRFAELTEVDVNFYAIDFDGKTEWERELPINDLHFVCALSVLNWLKNQSRFLSFLKNFTELLYEGHDSISIEASRLNSIGFMKLSLITVSERGRVIIYAKK